MKNVLNFFRFCLNESELPQNKFRISILFVLLTATLAAQKTYTVNDFFYRAVPSASESNEVEIFDGFLNGESAKYPVGEYHTLGTLNNRVTSFIVPEGLQVSFYFDRGFRGNKTTFLPGSYVSNWHSGDNAESMKIEKLGNLDGAYFLQSNTKPTDAGWGGKITQGVGPGQYNYLENELICNDCFTYLWVVGNVQVIVYDYANFDTNGANSANNPFSDTSPNKTGTMYNLAEYGFANTISSVDVALLNYRLHHVDRVLVGIAENLPDEQLNLNFTECNQNEDGTVKTVTKSFSAEVAKTVSTSLATGASLDFGIAHTTSATVGVPGLAEASVSIEVSANVGTSINWEDSKTTTITRSLGGESQNQTILPGRAIVIDFKTTPKKQKYKETYYFRPVKSKPNSQGEYEFIQNAAAREKKVEVDVVEITRNDFESVVKYRDCRPDELNGVIIKPAASTTSSTSTETASTMSAETPNTAMESTASTESPTNQVVDGNTVKLVFFEDGSFAQEDNQTWYEKDTAGNTKFVFEEIGRDDWSVYLLDEDRGIYIMLNLWKKDISYKTEDAAAYSTLYAITDSK